MAMVANLHRVVSDPLASAGPSACFQLLPPERIWLARPGLRTEPKPEARSEREPTKRREFCSGHGSPGIALAFVRSRLGASHAPAATRSSASVPSPCGLRFPSKSCLPIRERFLRTSVNAELRPWEPWPTRSASVPNKTREFQTETTLCTRTKSPHGFSRQRPRTSQQRH